MALAVPPGPLASLRRLNTLQAGPSRLWKDDAKGDVEKSSDRGDSSQSQSYFLKITQGVDMIQERIRVSAGALLQAQIRKS